MRPPIPVELIPALRRTRAWWTVAALGALVVIGGVIVHGDASPLGIELRIVHSVDRHAGGPARWRPVFDDVIPWGIVATVGVLMLWAASRRWFRAIVACGAIPLAIAVTELALKPIVGRESGGALLYPSGHLTGVAATATVALVLIGFRVRSRVLVGALVAVALAACAGALVAAVATHAHGPVDTVAGLPTGAAVALAWMLMIDAVASRSGPQELR